MFPLDDARTANPTSAVRSSNGFAMVINTSNKLNAFRSCVCGLPCLLEEKVLKRYSQSFTNYIIWHLYF